MLPLEHSAILSTFIKLPFVIKIFVLSIFELPVKTGFTVLWLCCSVTRALPFADLYLVLFYELLSYL